MRLICNPCWHPYHLFLLKFLPWPTKTYPQGLSLMLRMALRFLAAMFVRSHRVQMTPFFLDRTAVLGRVSQLSTYHIEVIAEVLIKATHKNNGCSSKQKDRCEGRWCSNDRGGFRHKTWGWCIGEIGSSFNNTSSAEVLLGLSCPISGNVWNTDDGEHPCSSRDSRLWTLVQHS